MVTRSAKYEYKTIPMPRLIKEFDDELNKLAKDMWEPINLFIPSNMEEFAFDQHGNQPSIFAIFRR